MPITGKTTVEHLAALIENYHGLQERIDKLAKTKEQTERLILEAFAFTNMTTFTTPSGLRAAVTGVGDPKPYLGVEVKKQSAHSLDVNRFARNQG